MLGLTLMRLIESHSDELALGLTEKLRGSERTRGFRNVPAPELRQTTAEVYRNLGEWLLKKTEKDIAERFTTLAARRSGAGIDLDELVWALIISRSHLWHFLTTKTYADTVVQLYGEMELQLRLNDFFDHAIYYTVQGYLNAAEAGAVSSRRSAESTGSSRSGENRVY